MWAAAVAKSCAGRAGSRRSQRGPHPHLPAGSSSCSVPGGHPFQRGCELALQLRRYGVPAARQRPDHYPVRGLESGQHGTGGMSETTRHPVAFYSVTDGFGDHQTDAGSAGIQLIAQHVNHHVGLDCAHATADGGTEFRGPPHPVLSRKHRARSCVESRSERAAALAAAAGDDGAAGAGPHTQPEPMHPRTATVVRLEGPLALGHVNLSLFLCGTRDSPTRCVSVRTRLPLISCRCVVLYLPALTPGGTRIAAVSPRAGDCSRVLTSFRWVKPETPCLQAMFQNGWHVERKLLASGNTVRSRSASGLASD